ncbi:MAG TPA: alpha/beta fold hydrolase [Nocardioidaceae bacterium]|nr:alpha/beta fold hydrolase [Nocardioidaceae bacterium]
MRSRFAWAMLVVALLALTACAPAASHTLAVRPPVPAVLGAHNDTSTPFKLVSLPALIEHEYDGRALRLDHVIAEELAFTRYHITYRSGDLRIGGVMNVPTRPGRHPVLVLAHGYLEPADYRNGAGLVREQAYLATNGFVVLHPDYRNYGDSDREQAERVAAPLGYPEDVVNAVRALRKADLPFADTSRIGLFGRSMGGGVALDALVARPDLVDAAVLYSPVSSLAADNFDRWVRGNDLHRDLEKRVVDTYGSPEDNPGFWRRASARNYLDRVDVPVQIHHGTADPICPVRWSEATAAALRDAGKDVRLFEYPGQLHRFDSAWPALMRRTVEFFRTRL